MPVTFTQQDIAGINNLLKFLNKSKIELEGAMEIIATAETMRWVSRLAKQIEDSVKTDAAPKPAAPAPVAAPVAVEPVMVKAPVEIKPPVKEPIKNKKK
jgi:hypothetical protein